MHKFSLIAQHIKSFINRIIIKSNFMELERKSKFNLSLTEYKDKSIVFYCVPGFKSL